MQLTAGLQPIHNAENVCSTNRCSKSPSFL